MSLAPDKRSWGPGSIAADQYSPITSTSTSQPQSPFLPPPSTTAAPHHHHPRSLSHHPHLDPRSEPTSPTSGIPRAGPGPAMAADPGAPHGGPPHHPYASQPHGQRTASVSSSSTTTTVGTVAASGPPPAKRSRISTPGTTGPNTPRERASVAKVTYPKKRVNVACEVCRSRKTRCDAARPSCSFCADIGAQCVYRRPEENLRPDEVGPDPPHNTVAAQPRPPDDQDVISRLARIESLLQQATAAPDHRDRTGLAQFGHFREGEGVPGQVPTPPSSHNDLTAVRPVHPLRFNIGFDLSGLSRLSGHDCPRELAPLCSSDTSERQLELELARSKDIFDGDYVHHESLDLSLMCCTRLKQIFCRDVLPWCPIFDQDDCADVVSRAMDSQFRHRSLDSCLALYVLAIGAFAHDPTRFSDDPARFPGVEYFRAACQIADAERLNANTVRYVQCQILQCFYLLYCLRPLLAHEAIQRASTKVVVLLQQHARVETDPAFQQQCIRAYWTCYLLEHELQAYIPWSSQILQCFNEDMKLPLSQYDEPGFYWFLAEITLRRIFSRPRGGLGWNQMFMICEPLVAREISQQLENWHARLPRPIKFALDDHAGGRVTMQPLLEPHKNFLRAQYYAIQATIFWPYVVRMLTPDAGPLSSSSSAAVVTAAAADPDTVEELARQSINFAVLKLYAVQPLMQYRHLLLLADLSGVFCITMLLLCAYEVPGLRTIQHPSMREAILVGWRCLRFWVSNPELKVRVEKMESLMRRKGLERDMISS